MKVAQVFAMSALLISSATFAQGPGGGAPPMAPQRPMAPRGVEPPMAPMPPHRGDHMGGGPEGRLLPPGTWWRNPDVVSAIALSPEQVKRIDGIFLESRVQLIHMHASLQEAELRLDSALNASSFDQARAQTEIGKVADMRADLEKANAKMLLSIRGVLNADQWTKLQAVRRPHGPGEGGERRMRHDGQGGGAGRGRGNRQGPPDGAGAPMPPPAE